MPQGRRSTEETFWARTVANGPCREWMGTRLRGYGRLHFQGRDWVAHRLAWTFRNGPIPAGMQVCHTCDNPWCVEPLHLFLGTDKTNTQDKVAKGRAKLQGRSGSANSQARLTEAQVATIRALYAAGGWSHRRLAAHFPVTFQTIGKVLRRDRWS